VKNKADLDVVVFMNDFDDMKSYRDKLPDVLEKLKQRVIDSRLLAEIEYCTPHALRIELKTEKAGDHLGVDILPAFDNIKRTGEFQNDSVVI